MYANPSALREGLASVKAILFDWDGVLVDSGEANYQSWCGALRKVGISIGRQEYFLLEGRKVHEIAGIALQKASGDPGLAASIALEKDRLYLEGSRPELFPSVMALLGQLRKAGYRLGLVSGATRYRLNSPPASTIRELLDVLVCGDDCELGKPAPEPYLRAAHALELEPASCLVVENAPLGIQAAISAGMLCIAVASTLDKSALSEASWILDDIGLLGELLVTTH